MVWNDAMFRTQAWESNLQLQGDQYRAQAAQQGLGSLQALGTAARLQLMEQERQENQIKIQSLLAVDTVKRSREDYRGMKLQNDSIELDMERRRKQNAMFEQDRRLDFLKAIDTQMVEGLATNDYVIDVGEDGAINLRQDQDASKTVLERLRTQRSAAEGRYQANNARQAYNALQSRYYRSGRYYGPPEERARIEAQMADLERQFTGFFAEEGGQPAPGAAPGAPGAQPPPQPGSAGGAPIGAGAEEPPAFQIDPLVAQMAGVSLQRVQQDEGWAEVFKTMPEESQAGLLYGMGQMAADLVNSGLTTPDMAPGYVMEAMNGNNMATAYVLTMSNASPERIRAILAARGQTPESIDGVMERLDSYIEQQRKLRKLRSKAK